MLNKTFASMTEAPAQGINRPRKQKGRKKACPPHVCELRTPTDFGMPKAYLCWKACWWTKIVTVGKGRPGDPRPFCMPPSFPQRLYTTVGYVIPYG